MNIESENFPIETGDLNRFGAPLPAAGLLTDFRNKGIVNAHVYSLLKFEWENRKEFTKICKFVRS